MGYFDISSNSPGALLTKLSIDTTQIDSLILNIVGGIMTVISTYLISIILGLQYDWKIKILFLNYGICSNKCVWNDEER